MDSFRRHAKIVRRFALTTLLASACAEPSLPDEPSPPINPPLRCDATPPLVPSTIMRLETLSGTAATSFAVGAPMAIVSTGFSADQSQNLVTFNDTPAMLMGDPSDPTRRLLVVVPTGIPCAPSNPGEPARNGVVVKVQSPLGGTASASITVTAPVTLQPRITAVAPLTQTETGNITITGLNFTPQATVSIRGMAAPIVGTPTATEIVAQVPDFGDILAGTAVPATVSVSVPGAGDSILFNEALRIRGL